MGNRCLERRGIIPFGYSAVDHHACLGPPKWGPTSATSLVAMGRNGQKERARAFVRLKDFYGLPDDTLWVTNANGHLLVGLSGNGRSLGIANAGSDGPIAVPFGPGAGLVQGKPDLEEAPFALRRQPKLGADSHRPAIK